MTASPSLNGHKRPTMPVLGDWRPATPEPAEEQSNPQPEPTVDAEVARAKAWAEVEERRIAAEAAAEKERIAAQAEADATRIKAEEEARKLRLANDRVERKAREEDAASEARIAESRKRKADADRAREEADRLAAEQRAAAETEAAEVEEAENRWRGYARSFYIVCAIVALPVQVAAFYNPHALWLMAAPLMLEGGAWVVLKGAAAAVAGHRPHWHYRLIAWCLAFIAASINLWHGLHAFDPATAVGTAFASVAGPGVYDLHEHGQMRKRDGRPTRRQRREAAKAARQAVKAAARREAEARAEREAAEAKAAEDARQLAADREAGFPEVWKHALKLAAALGETTVTDDVWVQAHIDIEGVAPGESATIIRTRNAAQKRIAAARSEADGSTPVKVTKGQRAIQIKTASKRSSYRPVPPRRTRGDTPPYHAAARAAIGETKRKSNATNLEQS